MDYQIGAIFYPIVDYLLENNHGYECKNFIMTNRGLYRRLSWNRRTKGCELMAKDIPVIDKLPINCILKDVRIDIVPNHYDYKILVLEFSNGLILKFSRQYLPTPEEYNYRATVNIINYFDLQTLINKYILEINSRMVDTARLTLCCREIGDYSTIRDKKVFSIKSKNKNIEIVSLIEYISLSPYCNEVAYRINPPQ